MQTAWLDWVKQGRPQLTPETSPIGQLVASTRTSPNTGRTTTPPIFRAQSPDDITPIGADSTKSPVVVASASGSVYAAMADKAERGQQRAVPTAESKPPVRAASVYDASLGKPALLR
jgi:hypothetical protein